MPFSKMAVAIDQAHEFKSFSRSQRCRLQSLTHLDYNFLEFQQTNPANSLSQSFQDESMHRSLSTPCFSISTKMEDELDSKHPKIEILGGHKAPTVRALVAEVTMAMVFGAEVVPLPSGLGGAYLLRTINGHNIAVAKPVDEEPLAFNNPKGYGGLMLGQPGVKRSIRVGETGIRELAAYLLDHHGFTGIPPTALVKISHVSFHVSETSALSTTTTPVKVASLQRFVDHDFDAGELGFSGFSVASIHRIGIFDVRVLNLDRHAGNILVKKQDQNQGCDSVGMVELVPIDHGLCLPEFLDDPYFEWLHWPQALVPFSDSELQYISDLDPFKDAELLRTELPSLGESSIRILVLCTIFLKEAAAAGLCLADIGQMMTREFCSGDDNLSILETLCAKAKSNAVAVADDDDDEESGDRSDEESECDFDMFQFDDDESEDCPIEDDLSFFHIHEDHQMLKLHVIPSFSPLNTMPVNFLDALLSPPYDETTEHQDSWIRKENANKVDNRSSAVSKVGCLTRSMSHPVRDGISNEPGSVAFADMTEGEWELVLENFKSLLPEVFESAKSKGQKLRLGTSCKF